MTRSKLLVLIFLNLVFLAVGHSQGGCNLNVDAGPDLILCKDESGNLNGMVSGDYDDYQWMPTTGLGNPFDLNTSVTVSQRTIYRLVATGTGNNIIINGGFESGSLAPSTTTFSYVTVPNLPLSPGGSYTIGTSVNFQNIWGCSVHGGTYALGYNGTNAAGSNIWCQTVNVNPNTDYKAEAWLMSVVIPLLTSAPSITIEINGTAVGSTVGSPTLNCSWSSASGIWNSGGNNTATVCIVNNVGARNFGGLDDISLKECCEAEDEIIVDVEDVRALIDPAGPITCDNPILILNGSGSSTGPGYRYEWSTNDGLILSGANTLNPTIGAPGTYTLRVISPNDCKEETMITIEGSVTPPDVRTFNVTLSCDNDPALVAATSTNPDVTFTWTGPDGFRSFDPSFRVSKGGTYYVRVEDNYKCFSIDSVVVLDDRSFPEIDILGDTISCGRDSVILGSISPSWKLSYTWTGPYGNSGSDSSFIARDSGRYILMVKDSNDCVSADTFVVSENDLAFDAFATADTITCANPVAKLVAYSDSSNVIFDWSGPNGFIASGDSVIVTDTGNYILTATYDSLCAITDTVRVFKTDDVPQVSILGDTIDCRKDTAFLQGSSATPGSSLHWYGPGGFESTDGNISVSDSGVYILEVTGPNGCMIARSFEVVIDRQTPDFRVRSDTLTCRNDSAVLALVGIGSDDQVIWSGPGGLSSTTNTITTDIPGEYFIKVTGINGCEQRDTTSILNDREAPYVIALDDTITCSNPEVTLSVINSDISSWNWQGPMGISFDTSTISTDRIGMYNLTVVGHNGCDTTISFEVRVDTVKPQFSLLGDTLDCNNNSVTLEVNTMDAGLVSWSGPGGFTSTSFEPEVQDSGWYVFTFTKANGCSRTDSIYIVQTEALPDISARGDTLNCVKDSAFLTGTSSTPDVSFMWLDGQNNVIGNRSIVQVDNPGLYTLTVTSLEGCKSQEVVRVVADTIKPEIISIASAGLKCDSTYTNLLSEISSDVVRFEWTGPGNFYSTDQNPRVSDIGRYYLTIYAENGCSSTDSIFLIAQDTRPYVQITSDTITCINPQALLTGNSNTENVTFEWTGPGGFYSSDSIVNVTVPGLYFLRVRDENDCSTLDSVWVTEDLRRPDAMIFADTIYCESMPATISSTTTPSNSGRAWFYSGQRISTDSEIMSSEPGIYTLVTTHPETGCKDTVSEDIIRSYDTIQSALVHTEDISCMNVTGLIEIQEVSGSLGPYEYSLNGQDFQVEPIFEDLSTGHHEIVIRDRYGCEFVTSAFINQKQTYTLNLPPNVSIQKGGKETITVITNIPTDRIAQISWLPGHGLSCTDCLSTVASPDFTTTYKVVVTDIDGCTYQDSITVEVVEGSDVYVPNIFSPNGDQLNDIFTVYSNTEAQLDVLAIFDRWGELVFRVTNGTTNDDQYGWDGTFDGERVKPGVYVYYVIIEVEGQMKVLSGDITLMD